MAPKVSKDHEAERKWQILNAAIQCFAEKGFHKTSMKDICQTAELSPGAVYSYFSSKDEIIETVFQTCNQENVSIFNQTKDHRGSMAEQMAFNLSGFKSMLENEVLQPWFKAGLMFRSEALTNAKLMELSRANYQTVIAEISALIENWQQLGEIDPDVNSKTIAQLMFSMVSDVGNQKMMDPTLDLDAYFKSLVNLVVNGLKANN